MISAVYISTKNAEGKIIIILFILRIKMSDEINNFKMVR